MDIRVPSKDPDSEEAPSASAATPRDRDDRAIKSVSLLLVGVVVVVTVFNGEIAARAIEAFRTFVTSLPQ